LINEKSISENDKKIISSTPEQNQSKTIQEKTVNGERIFILGNADADEKERSLSESIKNLGPIDDILYMADGVTIIDGRHRLAECPNVKFNKRILENCKTEDQAIIVDLAKNCNRRPVPPEEKRQKIGILATKYHKTINEIADATGIGHTTVDRYYPQEFKDKAHSQSGIASGKARALKATQPTRVESEQSNAQNIVPIDADIEKEPVLSENCVPNWEQNPTQEPTSEEKINALNAEDSEEQQTLEKLISDATADLPDDFKHAVYDLAVNPAKELKQKRLSE
jgi:hypothetical protein